MVPPQFRLAALLVNIQSGYAAYGPTMATVGGRAARLDRHLWHKVDMVLQ